MLDGVFSSDRRYLEFSLTIPGEQTVIQRRYVMKIDWIKFNEFLGNKLQVTKDPFGDGKSIANSVSENERTNNFE